MTVRLLTRKFGAAGAGIFEGAEPMALHPSWIKPAMVFELEGMKAGTTRLSIHGGGDRLSIVSYPVKAMPGLRVTAAWKLPAATPDDPTRLAAAALSDWIDRRESSAPPADWPDGTPAGQQWPPPDPESSTGLVAALPAVLYRAELGPTGRWLYVSPQIQDVTGYTPEEWCDDPELWLKSIHPEDLDSVLPFEDARLAGRDWGLPIEYRLRTRTGRYVWVQDQARLVPNKDETPVWYGVMQDINDLKEAELEVARQSGQQALVSELAGLAARGGDLQHLLAVAVDGIAGLDGVIGASIWQMEGPNELRVLLRSGEADRSDHLTIQGIDRPVTLLLAGDPLLIPDWGESNPDFDPYRDLTPAGAASTCVVPILGAEEHFGVLIAHSDRPAAFSPQDGDFLLAAAGIIGNAIERYNADQLLQHRLQHDLLTGLPNRRQLTSRIDAAIRESGQPAGGITLLLFDIDHFKLINDGVGHGAGDEILRTVTRRLKRNVGPNDTVSRLGGDEFAVLLTEMADRSEAVRTAARMLDSIARPIEVQSVERRITASAGVAPWLPDPAQPQGADDLIREADAAMHAAKDAGRNQVRVYDQTIRSRILQRLEVERELHDAIPEGQLRLRYQPIIDLADGHPTGFEGLVRWDHPTRGLLPPSEFVPIAEESDLICEIDSWSLGQAIADARSWDDGATARDGAAVSVNFSGRQLIREGLVEEIRGLLDRFSLAPQRLTIELTETTLLSGSERVTSILKDLDRLGVRLSLDDFGTGFSSLSYLGEFPLHEIKIDRSFVELLHQGDPRGIVITESVIRIGKALNMDVVAEAIPDYETLAVLRDMGCDRGQGRLIAPPLEPLDARQTVASRRSLYPV